MPEETSVGPPRDEEELSRFAELLSQCFALTPEDGQAAAERMNAEGVRLLRRDGEVACGLGIFWMGQYFGGRSVPMAGIGGVGTAPESRGKRAAFNLMKAALEEIREKGYALSALYPATRTLYRSLGYEQAGTRFEIRLSARGINVRDRELEVRPIRPEDHEAVRELHGRYARQANGNLNRGPYVWNKVYEPRGRKAKGYFVGPSERPEGYIFVLQKPMEIHPYELQLTDLAATTPRAVRRLLTLMADHRSTVDEIVWYGGTSDPFLAMLPEQAFCMKLHLHWMLRVVDVEAALGARGYPRGLTAEFHLHVRDEVLPQNEGPYVLSIEDGRAHVEKGGRGDFRIDARGMAAMYAGHLSSAVLRLLGHIEANDQDLAIAASVFAGAESWMPDMF